MNMLLRRCMIAATVAAAGWLIAPAAQARTIEVEGEAFDRAALLDERMPRASWIGAPAPRSDVYRNSPAEVKPGKTFLLRYDLEGVVPEGMRITRALWVLPVTKHSPDRVRIEVWRMIGDWGPGVSHELRTAYPEPQAWGEPGGRGPGVDRALNATTFATVSDVGEISVNVTRDVDLWRTGAAPNHGWMITVEDAGSLVTFHSPIVGGRDNWKLRITYEPE